MDPFPSISKVFSLILQEEKLRAVAASTSQSSQVAFAVKTPAPMKSSECKPKGLSSLHSLWSPGTHA